MKKALFTILFAFVYFSTLSQTYPKPTYSSKEPDYLIIDKAELIVISNQIQITFSYMAPRHYKKGGWVSAANTFYIKQKGKRFKNIEIKGIPISPAHHEFEHPGEILTFSILFVAPDSPNEPFDLIESDEGGFEFNGVTIGTKDNNKNTFNDKALSELQTEADYKKYISDAIPDGDYIVGIYRISGWMEQLFNGSVLHKKDIPFANDIVVILRKGDCFIMKNIPNDDPSLNCVISSTSQKGVYIKDDEYLSVNQSGNLQMCRKMSDKDVAEFRKISISDVKNYGLAYNICTEYVRIYPTQRDYEESVSKFKEYFRIQKEKEEVRKLKNSKSTGTGFAISSDGIIVTNYHVIENADEINIKGINNDFSIKMKAKVIAVDEKNDLALIKINDPLFKSIQNIPYKISNQTLEVSEPVNVLGYPLTATMGEEVKYTNGTISSKSGFKGDLTTYQISAPVQPGNSGGPVFDSKGDVVAIINARHFGAENVSYAIKSMYLNILVQSLPTPPKILSPQINLAIKPMIEKIKLIKKCVYIIEVN